MLVSPIPDSIVSIPPVMQPGVGPPGEHGHHPCAAQVVENARRERHSQARIPLRPSTSADRPCPPSPRLSG